MSLICAGKRIPSYKMALKIVEALGLNPEEKEDFLSSLALRKKELGVKRISPALRKMQHRATQTKARDISIDLFKAIADWYHYAILELTFVPGFPTDPAKAAQWVAHELGIKTMEAKLALERLEDLELLCRGPRGEYMKSDGMTSSADKHLTTAAHRRRQHQILEKSIHSLENDPISKRNHTAVTMAADPAKLPEAKRRIDAFMDELCAFLESGDRKQVLEMQISLFPLSKGVVNE
jgi:uncharacterized protein (TIGR02147 family)